MLEMVGFSIQWEAEGALSTLWSDAVSKLLVSILKVLIIASKCLTADLDTLLLAKGHTLSKCPYFVTESPFCPKI